MKTSPFDTTPDVLSEHVLRRRGCPLHYWTSTPANPDPAKPTLVFLHGAFMDHRMFNAQVMAFADEYPLLLMDSRGQSMSRPFGENSTIADLAEDVVAVLKETGVTKPVLIGQSMGSYISQHLTLAHPEIPRALVLIGSTPIPFEVSRAEMAMLKTTTSMMKAWPLQHFRKITAAGTADTPDAQRYVYEQMCRHGRNDIARVWPVVVSAIRGPGFPLELEIPVLLLRGEGDDRGTISRDMDRWASENAEFEYHVLPNAGHNVNQDAPEQSNKLIADFLQRLPG